MWKYSLEAVFSFTAITEWCQQQAVSAARPPPLPGTETAQVWGISDVLEIAPCPGHGLLSPIMAVKHDRQCPAHPGLVWHSGIQSVKPHNWLITAQSTESTHRPRRAVQASTDWDKQQTAAQPHPSLWDDLLPRLPRAAQQMRSCAEGSRHHKLVNNNNTGPQPPGRAWPHPLVPRNFTALDQLWLGCKNFMKGFEESPEILRGKMWLWGLRALVLPTVGWAGLGRSCWKIKASKL